MEKDKNVRWTTRENRRWTAVDTGILLLVLVAVIGLFYRVIWSYNQEKASRSEAKTYYRIHFTVEEMQLSVFNEMEGGDMLYIREDGTPLGYIARRVVEGATESDASSEEASVTYDKAMVPHHVDEIDGDPDTAVAKAVEGVIVCTEWQLSDGSLINGQGDRLLTLGTTLDVRTDRAVMQIRITDIKAVE